MALYTVLYVDDEPDLLLLGKTFLEKLGDIDIDTQESAPEGLAALRKKPYDAIISDYQMPEVDGLAFLKAVRSEFGDLPFILFTGRGREDVVIEAINSGADFYLQKGGDIRSQFAELSHKINMAVGRNRALHALHDSEKRLISLFHASPIHQLVTDYSSGRIIDINDRYLTDLKIPRTESIGKTVEELGLIPDPRQFLAIRQKLEQDGVVRNAELLVHRLDGRTFTTLTSMTRVQVPGQDLVYTQSMDITARKSVHNTIDALLNAPPDVSMLLDTEGTILAVNQAASTRFRTPVDDLVGKNAYTLLSSGLADLRRDKIDEAARTKSPLIFLDDRTGRTYENHVYPIPGPDGDVVTLAVYSRDITDENRAKEALHESEEKYRLIVENSKDTIYIYRNNRLLYINQRGEDLTGYTRAELMGRDLWEFLHPEDRARLQTSAARRIAGEQIFTSFNARIQRKNGDVRDSEFFVERVDFQGQPAIFGIARDITDKKRAEEALRERDEQLRSLADNLPLGMVYQVIREPDGARRYVHMSAGVEVIHEISPETVLQNPMALYSQIVPGDLSRVREAEEHSHITMSLFSIETRIRTPSGKERWVLLRSAPRPLPGGRTLWDGIELDITAIKRADESLESAYEQLTASQEELRSQLDQIQESREQIAESEEKYRTLVNHTEDGVFIARDGALIFVNETYAAMCGYTVEEMIGKSFDYLVAPEDREMVVSRHLDRLSGSSLSESYVFSLLHRNGTRRIRVKIRVGTSTYQGRRVTIGTLHDITEEQYQKAALAESEARYRSLTEFSEDVIMLFDRELRHIYVNSMAEQVSGIPVSRFIGKTHSELGFPSDLVNLWDDCLRRAFSTGKRDRIEFSLPDRGIWIDWLVMPVRGSDGTVTEVITSSRDITDRKHAEDALRESERQYRMILDNLQDAYFRVDLNGSILMASPSAAQMFGYDSVEEMLGMPMQCLENTPHVIDTILKLLKKDGRIMDYSLEGRRRNGTAFWVSINVQYYQSDDGEILGTEGIVRDITDRKLAEDALKKSEENYRNIIENMQDVFYRLDREGVITMISQYGARIVGYESPADLIGKMRATDFYADPTERDAFLSCLMENKVVSGYPLTLTDRYGGLHNATASVRLLFDAIGNVDGIEGILHDVTPLKEVENALRQANRQITLMTSITRHDIRNQLMALGGWLELSRASVADPDAMLELITKEQKIADVIAQQISFTSILDDMGVKAPTWQNPADLVEKSRAALPFGKVRLEVDLPGMEIFADLLFEKGFYNLLDNALRYGGENLTTTRVYAKSEKDHLLLMVEDDGVGIPTRHKARLFERGFGKNTGLGLFLAHEILSITGITIQEHGKPGRGARFEMRIPKKAFRYTTANTSKDPKSPPASPT